MAELGIRCRTVRDATAVTGDQLDVGMINPHAVDEQRLTVENAGALEQSNRCSSPRRDLDFPAVQKSGIRARTIRNEILFVHALRHVHRHRQILLGSIRGDPGEQCVADRIRRVR